MKLLDRLFDKVFGTSPSKGWTLLSHKRCPACGGEILSRRAGGALPEGGRWDGIETICAICGKDTIDDPWMPDNDNPVKEAFVTSRGWVTCPCCRFRFKPSDMGRFREGRHRRCGQLVEIKAAS